MPMPSTGNVGGEQSRLHTVQISFPFPTAEHAQIAKSVIDVDRELRYKDVHKTLEVKGSGDKAAPAVLDVTLQATTVRHARLSLNGLLENLALITRTMRTFDPTTASAPSSATTANEQEKEPLEQGSVGRAG